MGRYGYRIINHMFGSQRREESITGQENEMDSREIKGWDAAWIHRGVGSRLVAMALVGVLGAVLLGCSAFESSGANTEAEEDPIAEGDSVAIHVDNGISYQKIEGFGADTQPLVFQSGDNLTSSQRQRAIEAVYEQVGLTMGHLSVGLAETPADASDPWAERANDNSDPFAIDESGFNWSRSNASKEKIVDLAQPFGFDNYSLKSKIWLNGLDFLAPLRDSDYDRYLNECAEYVLAVLEHWKEAYGIVPRTVTLFNEPTSGNNELNGGSAREIRDIIKRTGNRLREAGFSEVKFVVPNEETVRRTLNVSNTILKDPEARQYVAAIGYHPYPYGSPYSSPLRILEASGAGAPNQEAVEEREQLRDFVQSYDIPLWMTEVSQGPKNADFPFGSFENLRARAIHIHDEMIYGGVSAYFGMNAMWDSKTHREHFGGRNAPFFYQQSTITLIDKEADEVHITGIGYAIGHYARWLNEGAVRIQAESSEPRVQVTALFRQKVASRAFW